MFQFPFGTMHQLNLDWFLGEWENYKQEWADAQAGIDNALQGEIDRVEDAMTDLYDARDAAVQAKEDAEDAADSAGTDAAQAGTDALKAEGYAVGEQDGTPVGAGSPYYQQNAKYYKVEAGTYRYLSEAYAKGEMGGSPVAPGEAGYQDNAKYYKDAADLDASTASSAATSAGADALLAEGYSVGEQNGTPVPSGSPYYQNNAKYYAAEAQQDKDDADAFKDSANQAALRAEGYSSGTQNGTPVGSGSPYYENNAAYFYGMSAGTSGDLAQKMISASEEASATAAYQHSVGSYFRLYGKLYQATVTINIGDTITAGTNCVEKTVGEELASQSENIKHIEFMPYIDNFPDYYTDTRAGTKVEFIKNTIKTTKISNSSTYVFYSVFGKKYLSQQTLSTASMTDDDFVNIEFDGNNAGLYLWRVVQNVVSSSPNGIYIATKNPNTGVITTQYNVNDGVAKIRYFDILEAIPEIITNKNFGIIFRRSNSNDVNEVNIYLIPTLYQTLAPKENYTKIASRNYAVNDFLQIGNSIYKVTQPILTGATLTVGTNISLTSVGRELTAILNS